MTTPNTPTRVRRLAWVAVSAVVAVLAALVPTGAGARVGDAAEDPWVVGPVPPLERSRFGPVTPRAWDPPSIAPRGVLLDLGHDLFGTRSVYDHERDRLFLAGPWAEGDPGASTVRVLDTRTGRWSDLEGVDGARVIVLDPEGDRLLAYASDPRRWAVVSLATLEVVDSVVMAPYGTGEVTACPSQDAALVQGLLWMRVTEDDRDGCGPLGGLDLETGAWFVPEDSSRAGQQRLWPETGRWPVHQVAEVSGDPTALLVTDGGGYDDEELVRLVVTRGPDGRRSVTETARERTDIGIVRDLESSADGAWVYLVGAGGLPEVRDARTLGLVGRLGTVGAHGQAVSVRPDSLVAVAGSGFRDADVFLFRPGALQPYRAWELGLALNGGDSRQSSEAESSSLVLGDDAAWTVSVSYLGDEPRLRRVDVADRVRGPSIVRAAMVPPVVTYGERTRARIVVRTSPAEAGREIWFDGERRDDYSEQISTAALTDARGGAELRFSRPVEPRENDVITVDARPTDRVLRATTTVRVRVRPATALRWDTQGVDGFVRPSVASSCVRIEVQRLAGPRGLRRWRPTPWTKSCAVRTGTHRDDVGVVGALVPRRALRSQVLRARLVVRPVPGRYEGVTTGWERLPARR